LQPARDDAFLAQQHERDRGAGGRASRRYGKELEAMAKGIEKAKKNNKPKLSVKDKQKKKKEKAAKSGTK
jgi:hypothetical protein